MSLNISVRNVSAAASIFLKRTACRCYCSANQITNAEIRRKRCKIYDEEKKIQRTFITRIEKIKVEYKGVPENCTLIMNKGLSTPYNCTMHIGEHLSQRSALAIVNDELWDMHRPLTDDCELQLLHFKDEDPSSLNKAFWTSCSFLLGHMLETAFKDQFYVELCGFPRTKIETGSFVHDAVINTPFPWKPTSTELQTLSKIVTKLAMQDARFERLEVDASIALEMFADNKYKTEQIPLIASKSASGHKVILYRVADHIDMSLGPMIGSSAHVGIFNVTAVHPHHCAKYGDIQRVQGVALPSQLSLHHHALEQLTERASKKNNVRSVGEVYMKAFG